MAKRLTNREFRRRKEEEFEQFSRFKKQYESVFKTSMNGTDHRKKRALIISKRSPCLEVELSLIKALEIGGYDAVVLIIGEDRVLKNYYEMAGVKDVLYWSEFLDPIQVSNLSEAIIEQTRSMEEILSIEYGGTRAGKAAVVSLLRQLRIGSLDLQSAPVKQNLLRQLELAMATAVAVQKIVRKFQPAIMLSADIEYTPQEALFNVCLANDIDVIKYEVAHKPNSLMFKRYTLANRDQHFSSLSAASWQSVREMEWTEARRNELENELYNTYASGDWYGICATQFNKRFMPPEDLQKCLSLDFRRKTAFIFAHIPWDASLTWGKDIFDNYEEWLIETVRTACTNDQVNWIIKIHPANVGKRVKEGLKGDPAEVLALRKYIGQLPAHISLLHAESDISTFSLYAIMDYCLTVRGTVGIEAASFGIPVLTAGTGRYDHKGFTIDSETREQYRMRLAQIQKIPRLLPAQRELAERFAYGMLLLRPFPLTTATFDFTNDQIISKDLSKTKVHSNVRGRLNISSDEDWHKAADLRAFVDWVNEPHAEDFLLPVLADNQSTI